MTDMTTLQIQKDTRRRFKRLLSREQKRLGLRRIVNDDFMRSLLDIYEEKNSNA